MKVFFMIVLLNAICYALLYYTAGKVLRRYIGQNFVISWFLATASAMFSPSADIYLILLFFIFIATVRSRVDAVCRFVLLAVLVPIVTSFLAVGGAYLLSISSIDVLLLGVVAASVIHRKHDDLPRLVRPTTEDAFVAALVTIFWVGGVRFPSVTIFLRGGAQQALLILLPYLVLRRSIRSSGEVKTVLACIAFAAAVLGLLAFYEARNGWNLYGAIMSRYAVGGFVSQSALTRGGVMRSSVTMSPLPLACFEIFGLIAALYIRNQLRSKRAALGWIVAILLGVLSAQSRGNLLLLPIIGMVYFVARRKWGVAIGMAVAGVAGYGLLRFVVARFSPRVAAFLNVGDQATTQFGAYDYRQVLLQRGLEEAAKHRWTGARLEAVINQLSDITQGQGLVDLVNTYLTIYLISGMVGLVTAIGIFLAIMRKLFRRLPPAAGLAMNDTRAVALTMLTTLAVQLSFMSFMDRIPMMLAIALVGARIVGIERRRLRRTLRRQEQAAEVASLAPQRISAQPRRAPS